MSKTKPLLIAIRSNSAGLLVQNNRQPKAIGHAIDFENGLDNLVIKYRLLNAGDVVIKDEEKERRIFLPLIENPGGLF